MPDTSKDQRREFITMSELSDELRTPIETLRYWRGQGRGPQGHRFGRRVLYRRTDVDSWVDRMTADP